MHKRLRRQIDFEIPVALAAGSDFRNAEYVWDPAAPADQQRGRAPQRERAGGAKQRSLMLPARLILPLKSWYTTCFDY